MARRRETPQAGARGAHDRGVEVTQQGTTRAVTHHQLDGVLVSVVRARTQFRDVRPRDEAPTTQPESGGIGEQGRHPPVPERKSHRPGPEERIGSTHLRNLQDRVDQQGNSEHHGQPHPLPDGYPDGNRLACSLARPRMTHIRQDAANALRSRFQCVDQLGSRASPRAKSGTQLPPAKAEPVPTAQPVVRLAPLKPDGGQTHDAPTPTGLRRRRSRRGRAAASAARRRPCRRPTAASGSRRPPGGSARPRPAPPGSPCGASGRSSPRSSP